MIYLFSYLLELFDRAMPAGCEILKECHKGLDAIMSKEMAPALLARWQKYTLFNYINQAFARPKSNKRTLTGPFIVLYQSSIHQVIK